MTPHRSWATLAALCCSIAELASAADSDPALLTVDRIYRSDEFSGEGLSARWLADSSGYTTLERSDGPNGGRDIVRHDPESGAREILVAAKRLVPTGSTKPLEIDDYEWSANRSLVLIYTNSKRVWRRNTRGDYWLLDRSSHELKQLGGDAPPASLMFAKLSPTCRHVAYVRANNIYVEDIRNGTITPITSDGGERIINGTFDWVYEEELGLRDGIRWSPDGMRIAFWRLDTEGVRTFTLINNTAGLYPKLQSFKYPKAGEQNAACEVAVARIDGTSTRRMKLSGDPRDHYIARMDWIDDGELIIQQLNRLQNTNRVLAANADNGDVRCVLVDRDEAWVEVCDSLEWLNNRREFTWLSERDAWKQVYRASRDGKEIQRITSGTHDVIDVRRLDRQSGWLYYSASPENPTQRYLYRARLDGSHTERVTPVSQPGCHHYQISPDARWALHRFSRFGRPGVVELVRLPGHEQVRVLVDNAKLRDKVEKLKRGPGEFLRVDAGDGTLLDGWCMNPPDFDPQKKYPVLIYVYGEPAGQTTRDRWGGRRYLWHLLLTQRGYVVMSFDNRGTRAPRGRVWRKSVYRKIGIFAPADQAGALRQVLKERPYLDGDRVGIWGWSGGGSMSLNAIFRYPDLYHVAVSIAPVPNQRLYDTIYQERYMGLPNDNVEGFRKGSPIHFADQLEGKLLLVHGTGDDNCHYQGTEALINELVRHNKPFSMMAYPNRRHGIHEGVNTSLHLRHLLTSYLLANLPPGGR